MQMNDENKKDLKEYQETIIEETETNKEDELVKNLTFKRNESTSNKLLIIVDEKANQSNKEINLLNEEEGNN
jgi:hypothetical protein